MVDFDGVHTPTATLPQSVDHERRWRERTMESEQRGRFYERYSWLLLFALGLLLFALGLLLSLSTFGGLHSQNALLRSLAQGQGQRVAMQRTSK